MTYYVHIVVRTDIPVAQQLVQASHAALECGFSCERTFDTPCHLVLLQVSSEEQLLEQSEHLGLRGIDHVLFKETSFEMGYSAFATKPTQRKGVLKLPLWSPKE